MRKVFFVLMTVILLLSSSSEAAKIDMYRNALLSKNFTIKYEVNEIPIIRTSKDATLSGKGLSDKLTTGLGNFQHKGIIVSNGDNSYLEIFQDAHIESYNVKLSQFNSSSKSKSVTQKIEMNRPAGGQCMLIKNNELFEFFWELKDGKKQYYGGQGIFGKTTSVKAGGSGWFTATQRLIREYNFGTPEIARALLPIMPTSKIIATPQAVDYKFFGSGSLDNGLTYEDYVADKSDTFSAVRYYFNGETMIKIAQVSYVKEGGKILGYEKSIIHITEFSPIADQTYLKLPESLKDKTKRNKEAKK